ncbi:MAG: DNA polymerase I [Bacteroidetes bacterium]|nr:MAG: DNA polymerase I [Bacteroidota bacterium]
MSDTKPKLFLLDAMALIYRAFFALNKNPRINSKGLNTSAILGFANTLYEVIKKEKPTHIGVAFDTMVPTQRHTDFPAYKANREKMPDDLAASIPYIIDLIKAFNIPILVVEGYEADDVIGTLAKSAEKEGFITYMMTPDKDFGQLLSDNIFMYKPARAGEDPVIWGVPEICERYGIKRPEQLIDILGLMGDASDNIPGVPGVGEKTASKLIADYYSIDNLLLNLHELKGKLKENIENNIASAIQSRQLATIITNVPIVFDPEALIMDQPDMERLKILFEELEFRTFAKRMTDDAMRQSRESGFSTTKSGGNDLFSGMEESTVSDFQSTTKKTIFDTPHAYISVTNEVEIQELLQELLSTSSVCFDTETTAIDAHTAELVGMSFAITPHKAWFVHLPENYHNCQQILSVFKPFFESPSIQKIGQNLKYDISVLSWYDIEVKGPLFDTMIAHYLLEPDQRHNMDVLAETYLNYSPVSIETLIGKKGKNQGSMRNTDAEALKEYAAEDADITLQLKLIFEPLLQELQLTELFEKIEMPLVPVLASMEAEGVRIDADTLKQIGQGLEEEIKQLEQDIYKLAGTTFNIASPKQLGEILFEKLGLTTNAKKTKTGQYPTGEEVLSKMIHSHPIVQLILDYRSLTKLKSTYVDTLSDLANPRDGRIHTSYNQAVASTGRLSSNNPNLQNIPIRTERGREIRKAFVPRNNQYTLLAADYSQIELRIIAHLSGDTGMIEAFNQGLDIHTATASKVYNVDLKDVTKEMRRNAKMVNFGIIYGISAFGLSERLGISRSEAAQIIQSYFREYPGIKAYMNTQIELARKQGFVETMLGRRRMLRDINNSNSVVRGFAERNAINAPIQGTSADMIKIAMIQIHNEMALRKMQSKMILQVHDELVFDAFKPEIPVLKEIVAEKMRNALPLSVAVETEMNTGENWLEAH